MRFWKIAAIILMPCFVLAQDIAPGLYFLKLGVGARACAMGEAFTAVANDASAVNWNPAGIGDCDLQFMAMHTEWLLDTRFEYLSGAIPLNFGTIGFYGIYLTSGDIEGRDEYGTPTDSYNNSDIALGIGYGRKFGMGFLFGFGMKFIQEKIEQNSGTGFGLDAGCVYKMPIGLNLGVAVQNLGTAIRLIEEDTKLPMTFRVGVSYTREIGQFGRIMPAFDLVIDNGVKENLGLEFVILNKFALRGGYRIGLNQGCLTAGTGISHSLGKMNLQIDYAYTGLSDLGMGHRISLGFRF
jgi:hypothetical protein